MIRRAIEYLRHHQRWLVLAMLFLIAMVNNLDRQVLSVLAPTLRAELHFGAVEYSNVVAAFLAAYTLGYVFSGTLLDRWGVRAGLAVALVFWSLAGMAHALASSWVALMVCRLFLGLGESFNSPGGLKAIAEWAPPRERALSAAVFSNGNVMGAIIAPPLVSFLALQFGWRWAFIVTGAVGILLGVVWWRFYRSPDQHPRLTEVERKLVLSETVRPVVQSTRGSWRVLLLDPLCLAFCLGRFLTDATNYFFAFWLPDYLQHGRGFSLALIGLVGWMPFLAADVGGPGGGALSDWLVRRGWKPARARLALMSCAALLMPLATVVVRAESSAMALVLLGVVLAAQSCWMANQLALISESAPRNVVATVVAISAMAGGIGGIITNLVAGRVIAAHGYVAVFSSVGWVHLIAVSVLYLVYRKAELRHRSAAETSQREL
jgi:ACS family hexuronate transporter-like MFS transporter